MEWRHVDELLFCRHPFTAEDQLVSKWCDATFFYICSDDAAKLIYILMTWGWEIFQQIFTIPLKSNQLNLNILSTTTS